MYCQHILLRNIGIILHIQCHRIAAERDEEKRRKFRKLIARRYFPEQLVFVDETAVDKRTTHRLHGWALKGQPAHVHAERNRGKR